jgi:hypothetical protein
MNESGKPGTPLGFILLPMLSTFAIQRIILHHSSPETHVFVAGYLVHHLFWGFLIQFPAACLLAFGGGGPRTRKVSWVALGVGSAMILDEVVFLIATDGSGRAYRSPVSLWGAAILVLIASLLLLSLHRLTARGLPPAR